MKNRTQRVHIEVALDRVSESLDSVVNRTNQFVSSLDGTSAGLLWQIIDAHTQWQPWTNDHAAMGRVIMERASAYAKSDPDGQAAFLFQIVSQMDDARIVAGPNGIGHPFIGTRIPRQTVSADFYAGASCDTQESLVGPVFAALIEAWEPLFGRITERELNREVATQQQSFSGWSYPIGYRVWLRDDVATGLDYLAEGLTRRDFAGGVLIAAPDAWSPEQIVTAFHDTYTRNGLVEVPHPVP